LQSSTQFQVEGCNILHFFFWAGCLPIYTYGLRKGEVVTNLNSCDIEALILESERFVKTLSGACGILQQKQGPGLWLVL